MTSTVPARSTGGLRCPSCKTWWPDAADLHAHQRRAHEPAGGPKLTGTRRQAHRIRHLADEGYATTVIARIVKVDVARVRAVLAEVCERSVWRSVGSPVGARREGR